MSKILEAEERLNVIVEKLLPTLKKNVVPIYRITEETEGRFVGDGFFLHDKGLSFRHGNGGHPGSLTPGGLVEAYGFYGIELSPEEDSIELTLLFLGRSGGLTFDHDFPPSWVKWISPSSEPTQIEFTSIGEGSIV